MAVAIPAVTRFQDLHDVKVMTLAVNQAAGTVSIVVTDNATVLLDAASELVWDVKTKDAAGVTVQNTTGTASIVRAVTQTI